MSGMYAPSAIHQLFTAIHSHLPTAQLGGIVGDTAHMSRGGYHIARYDQSSSNYSCTESPDKLGDGWAASALDVTLGETAIMHTVTNRLLAAKTDPRVKTVLREFFGCTRTGGPIVGWDWSYNGSTTSSDLTHRWHIHISIHREYANNWAMLAPVADVFAGIPYKKPVPAPKPKPVTVSGGGTKIAPKLRRKWPTYMKPGNYFGLITGPDTSHGGYYASEQPDIAAIQSRLNALGYSCHGDTTGKFQAKTKAAVTAWQKAHYAKQTSLFGQVWSDDWANLFTY